MTPESTTRRSQLKLALDVAMAVTFALLLNAHILGGLPFHETAGTLIGFAFLIHLFLNWSWVTQTTTRFVQATLPSKIRVGFLLNVLLLLTMAFIIISGVLISRIVFPGLQVSNGRGIQRAHITVAFLILGFVGAHVGLHWNWIRSTVQRWGNQALNPSRWSKQLWTGMTLGLLVFAGVLAYRNTFAPTPEVALELGRSFPSSKAGISRNDQGAGQHLEKKPIQEALPNSRHQDRGHHRDGKGGHHGGRSAWGVAAFYLGIMAIFALATHRLERWFSQRHGVFSHPR